MQSLEVRDYQVYVNLGCDENERAQKQEVRVSMEVYFASAPKACVSDALSDTLCYRELCKTVSACANAKPYQTVEHLFWALDQALRQQLPKDLHLNLKIHKVKPPIDGLLGGVVFGHKSSLADLI